MPFQRGNNLAKPRTGSKNQKTAQWERFTEYMLSSGLSKFQEEINKLEGRDYVQAITNLLEFFKPRLARGDQSIHMLVENVFTDEQAERILKLKNPNE